MPQKEQWIWLPKSRYPHHQTTIYSGFGDHSCGNYAVAEFHRQYRYSKRIINAMFRVSGDTLFQFACNGKIIATGPAAVGGDFLHNDTPWAHYYAYEVTASPYSCTLDLFSRVQLMPVQVCDYSKGHGGFMLWGKLQFEDGTETEILTDESWQVRKNSGYISPVRYDAGIQPDDWTSAEVTENIWHTETAPIPVRTEQILPEAKTFSLPAHGELEAELELDKIYAGFPYIRVKALGKVTAELEYRELKEHPPAYSLSFDGSGEYRGFQLCSTGNILAKLKNHSNTPAEVTVSYIITHYPIQKTAVTVTDDPELNQVLSLCRHSLKYCRQTHHLDSPKHCEPLACTGDYYIESLMTLFSFGDLRLAEFDLLRTARTLEQHDGRLFHTAYSLIWVRMLYDVYMASGNIALLNQCKTGLLLLLNRFERYLGKNGLIENPPDYMFIDWIYIDGLSMHHPPKALGQTCLNLFYFDALNWAAKIFAALGDSDRTSRCRLQKEALRCAINNLLFDAEKGIYFEGLNTPTPKNLSGPWMPANTQKRYYLKHSNILAAYVGICDDDLSIRLIHKIMSDEIPGDYQPYFAHYLLEAVFRCGLQEQYTLSILEKWKDSAKECPKGLVEGFVAPEPTYCFDHSHAWAGTPLYSLPKALMGLEILEPGMKKLRLKPSLLGLQYATAELLTPFGKVTVQQRRDNALQITHPNEVQIIVLP